MKPIRCSLPAAALAVAAGGRGLPTPGRPACELQEQGELITVGTENVKIVLRGTPRYVLCTIGAW